MIRITLLTKSHCHLCEHAKEVLSTVGRDLAFDLEVLSVESSDGAQLAQEKGIVFPPAVLIDGEPVMNGRVSEGKLRRELSLRGQRG